MTSRKARAAGRAPGTSDLRELQRLLEHDFDDPDLLLQALTHRSADPRCNYERLEFLGDALLGFVVADELFHGRDGASEKQLTLMRARLVRERTLARIGRERGLHRFVRIGSGAALVDSIVADVVESLIGAVLVDAGGPTARALVLRLLGDLLAAVGPEIEKDPKTRLQEHLQKLGHPPPSYEVDTVHGRPPEERFLVSCRVPGLAVRAQGEGSSRRRAEQEAATRALALIGEVS